MACVARFGGRSSTAALAALGTIAGAGTADASEQSIRISGFASAGNTCEATVTRNPAVIPEVTNINIKIGGPIGMAPPDPGFWHIDSPTVVMPSPGPAFT